MGELRLPGLATGIDTSTLIAQLMAINSRRLANYQVKKIGYEEETTAFSELRTKVSNLNSTVTAISNASTLEAYKASTSDGNVLGVAASQDAAEGSHSILINQLATTETWIQDTSAFDYKTDYVGGGTFIYSYNYQERQITAVANETTLEDFVGLINNDENNPGVTASLLYHDGKYHLMLSGKNTGEDYQISVNASSTEVWATSTVDGTSFTDDAENAGLSTKITELDQFTGTLGASDSAFIRITGEDHSGTAISPDLDLTVTANTTMGHFIDSINQHFDGVATATLENGEIRLTDHLSGASGMEITLSYDPGSGSTSFDPPLPATEPEFNVVEGGDTSHSLTSLSAASFIETQAAQDSEINIDGYPLSESPGIAEVQALSGPKASAGTFTLTYDGETTAGIAHNADTNTIETALEALSNVDVGDIIVSGGKLDNAGGDTVFTFRDDAGDVSIISIDDGGIGGGFSFLEETKGTLTTGWMRRNSNTITDALTGITLILQDVNKTDDDGNPIPVVTTLTRDISGVTSKVKSMVASYNSLITFLREKTEYNAETKEMGLLSRSATIPFLKTQLNDPFVGTATGFNDDDLYIEARQIGITIAGDRTLKLDTTVLEGALNTSLGFNAVIELIGAVAAGSTSSGGTISFYSASSKYTTAGTFDVEVTISDPGSGNVIESARMRQTGGTWHDAEISGNIITGDSTFNDSGSGPLYPENGLQLSVDLSAVGTFADTVRVKKGFAGELEDMLDDLLRTDGRLDVGEDINTDNVERIEVTIANEEIRLERMQDRLILKYARLEKTLTLLSRQMAAVSTISQATFG